MSETVNLPALGESVTEGTVTRWLKQVGDEVAVDEPLVEVSTDKVDTEIPSPVAGVIEKILVEEDEDVEVGAPLVVIGDGSGSGSGGGSGQDEAAADTSAQEAEDAATEAETPEATDEAAEQKSSGQESSGQEQAPQAEAQQTGEGSEITLPALGESVTEGTVTRWLKQVGDEVAVDEPLLEVSTDKVDTEVPSPVAGTLLEIRVQEDEDAEVGQVLAVIGSGSAPSGDKPAEKPAADTSAEEAEDAATEAETPEATDEAAEQKSSGQESSGQEQAPQAEAQQTGEGSEITLPALGESVTEGTVTRWLKQVGDEVAVDEPLLEVSTDKVDTEVPSPVAGTLLEIRVQEDEDAEVGQVLAVIGSGSAPSGDKPAEKPAADTSAEEKPAKQSSAGGEGYEGSSSGKQEKAPSRDEALVETDEPVLADTSGDEQQDAAQRDGARTENAEAPTGDNSSYVTPLVRKLAKKEGVDLSALTGTGVGGRIRKQDVLAAAEQQKSAAAPAAEAPAETAAAAPAKEAAPAAPKADAKRGTTEKAPRIRMTIAQRMRESLQEAAQLTQVTEVDMTRVAVLRGRAKAKFQEREGAKLTYLPFFAKAVAEALQAHPKLNATFKEAEKEIVYNGSENIAIAVDTPKGLLVPVIKNAGDLNLGGLAKQIADLGSRAKDGNITPDDLTGGTFTITNLGSFGALFDTPIINQPQVAILGTGSIVKRPMVVSDADGNDTIAIRQMCYLSLTYDHRLVDGADAGRFLQALKARLEEGRFESEVGL
ncbi:2-oxoglutarate dehydrogenase, E2 component, dihydrolipoamide succinyltransferase [Kocuria rosea]|uniref:2-oxoglutarate dehydrogenase, E2 component, dihydrolipoamide succinyltransferase n=1 Tax=Kocuria rosea TaxID=1275 RepID=UPI000D652377|nr:2-oxoglutarate dehydrogenase, E2 component, dihydrolipoamide succinyltransferase [Kocuria rosea]PWF80621.1 2-oxoglutarate dehydrogenase, E2 component, dihydrolipoamide succinyltransferase [Kocuria rosea]